MPTVQNNRPLLDLKQWEVLNELPFNAYSFGGLNGFRSDHYRQQVLCYAAGVAWMYDLNEDSFIQIPTPSASNVGTGNCAAATAWSTGSTVGVASLTATAGTVSTITTNQTLPKDLRGWSIHILAGPNAGQTLTISSNTIGANSVITVPTQGVAFSNATVYRLMTPRWFYIFGTSAGVALRIYDYATDTWSNGSMTNGPTAMSTAGEFIATPSWIGSSYNSFATGTATSATATTLVNSGKSWTSGQWVNYQIRIVSGTGAGQIRTITASDATSVTVATWTTTPDNTSTYSIEGNDDFLYLMGNAVATLWRYQISTNTWTTLSPSVARGGSIGQGMGGWWVSQSTNSAWTSESAIINGRRIYSIRGGSVSNIDVYDIPSNSWSAMTYSPSTATFALPKRASLIKDKLYAAASTGGSTQGRNIICIDLVTSEARPFTHAPVTLSGTETNNWAWPAYYKDGGTEIWWLYFGSQGGSSSAWPNAFLYRIMVV